MEINWTNLTCVFEDLENREGKWWIVSPFITVVPPIEDLSEIKVLMQGEVADFLEGSSSIYAVKDLLERGAEVRTLATLNAKAYIKESAKDSVVCFGSANLTNGDMKSNIELMSAPTSAPKEFMQHLHQLWEEARLMTPQEVSCLISMIRFANPWVRSTQEYESFRDVKSRLRDAEDLVIESFEPIKELLNNPSSEPPAGTVMAGFHELDQLTGGLSPGTLTIIAGRPSMGKSSLALTIVGHCLLKQHHPVLFFSLEMSGPQIVTRLECSEARVQMSQIRTGSLSNREFRRLADTAGRIAESPLFVDDTSDLSLEELAVQARLFTQEHPSFLLIVDYVQLMSTSSKLWRQESRHQAVAAISRGLKNLARELDIPIIAISQISRAVEARPNKRPMLSDLRESGQLEEDADLVLFVYRDEYYDRNSEKQGIAEIIVSKQRNGPVGMVELQFHNAHTRFNNLAKGF